jgi:hypothetical protein
MKPRPIKPFVVSLLLAFVLTGLACFIPIALFAAETTAATKVKHEPIEYFVPEKRIQLEAEVSDKCDIKLVRCYFKSDAQADYVFVWMKQVKGDAYAGVLPSPAPDCNRIEYLFLAVNADNQVVKTQTFTVNVNVSAKVPKWQEVSAGGEINLYTELDKAPKSIPGFKDSIKIDVVESSARFGIVAGGIYAATSTGGSATGAAAATTSSGTITATSGLSTTAIVAIGAGIAAGAGVAVAAGGGGGGGGGGGSDNKSNASVTWGDPQSPPNDAFRAVFDSENFGTSPVGGTSGMMSHVGLPFGDHTLTITCMSAAQGEGTFMVGLAGGAIFKNDGVVKTGTLAQGASITYQIYVSQTGSGTVHW